tara:strand:- start:12 stop:335 length:324 start_codon:yes stop_codon:yes gene_type:complete
MSNQNGGIKGDFDEVVSTLRAYVKQETVEPLKGLGRYLAFGLAGTTIFGIGGLFLVLATVRILQTTINTFQGNLSFLPYLCGLATCAVLIYLVVLALRRDGKRHSNG